MVLLIPGGKILKWNYVEKNMTNYNSILIFSHFKGRPPSMTGAETTLDRLASIKGKALIHSGDVSDDQVECGKHVASPEVFVAHMVEMARTMLITSKGKSLD